MIGFPGDNRTYTKMAVTVILHCASIVAPWFFIAIGLGLFYNSAFNGIVNDADINNPFAERFAVGGPFFVSPCFALNVRVKP